jgi:hypothetical protein
MDSIGLVFVHTGTSTPPECMIESLSIAAKVSTCKIYALINAEHTNFLRLELEKRVHLENDRLEFVDLQAIPPSEVSIQFSASAKIDRE